MLTSPQFYVMYIAFVLMATGGLLVTANAGPMAQRGGERDREPPRLGLGQLSSAWFAVTLVAVYFTWGQIYSLFPSTSGDYFGTRHATSNYAVLYTAKGVASIIGGYAAALLYEQSGSWAMGFYGSAVMALVAAVLAYGLRTANATAKAKAAKIPVTA